VGVCVNLAKIVIQAPMEQGVYWARQNPASGRDNGPPCDQPLVGAGLTPPRHSVTLLVVFEPPHSPVADGLDRFLSMQLANARGESSHWWQLVGLVL
jgi:hypothetical protein